MRRGEDAGYRFLKFFVARIRNPNTRPAYRRAACEFFRFCERRGVRSLHEIRSRHVAVYVEFLHLPLYRQPPAARDHASSSRSVLGEDTRTTMGLLLAMRV